MRGYLCCPEISLDLKLNPKKASNQQYDGAYAIKVARCWNLNQGPALRTAHCFISPKGLPLRFFRVTPDFERTRGDRWRHSPTPENPQGPILAGMVPIPVGAIHYFLLECQSGCAGTLLSV